MRRMQKAALGLAVLLLAATGAVGAQEPRIGYVNLNAILQNAPQIPAINQRLRSEFATRDAEFQSMQEDYNERVQTYERDRDVMSASERTTLERELTQMQRDIERRAGVLQEDLQIRQNELLNELQAEIVRQVQEYAEENEFDLVVTEAVYAGAAVNITAAVYEAITGQTAPPASNTTDTTSE